MLSFLIFYSFFPLDSMANRFSFVTNELLEETYLFKSTDPPKFSSPTSTNFPENVTIHDLTGVQKFSKVNHTESKLSIDISEYAGGLYLILVSDGKTTTQKKVIIKK